MQLGKTTTAIAIYNFEVEGKHTYFVSSLNVLVHNKARIRETRRPKSGSGKERASNVPSWARGERPFVGENGREFGL